MEVMDDLGYLFEVRRELQQLVRPLCAAPRTASGNAADIAVELMRRRH